MDCLNQVLNRIDDWSQPVNPHTNKTQGFLKRHLLTRASNIALTVPCEVATIAQNILKAPFQATGGVLNLGVKTLSFISGSETLKRLEKKLPTLTDFVKTIVRVIFLSLGTLFSATLGVIAPKANFRLHCAMNLIANNALTRLALLEEQIKAQAEEAKEKERLKKLAEEAAQAEIALKKTEQEQIEMAALENSKLIDDTQVVDQLIDQDQEIRNLSMEDSSYAITEDQEFVEPEIDELATEENHDLLEREIDESEPSTISWIANGIYNNSKALVKKTYNVAANIFNVATGFFSKQKSVSNI